MTITDLLTLFLSFYLLARGSSRGFMNSLIPPFSIILTTYLSIIYYQNTKDMIMSLAIGTIGPLIMNFSLKFLLRAWGKATNTDIKPDVFSRFGGSVLTLVWGWIFIILTLVLLAVLPPAWGKIWTAVHNDVTKSVSYCRIAQPLQNNIFAFITAGDPVLSNKVSNAFSNGPGQNVLTLKGITSNNDAKTLAQDPRFQKVLQDPDIQSDIKAHDIVKLMSNPKMMALTQQIMSDPATMQRVMALYKSQIKPQAEVNAEDSNPSN